MLSDVRVVGVGVDDHVCERRMTLVAHEHLGLWPRLGHDRCVALDVGDLAAGEDHGDRQAQAVGPQMSYGDTVRNPLLCD